MARNMLPLVLAGFIAASAAAPVGATILWTDNIQAGVSPWGFSGLALEHPIGQAVEPSDANGVNLSRVANPQGAGYALRHLATFDEGGSRSTAGIWSFSNAAFNTQAKSAAGVWVAQEWYFPAALKGGSWLNLWDWHSTDIGGGNRWHTSPGLMLSQDGAMKIRFEWGGPAGALNPMSAYAPIALPVGEWFDVEMHYVWSAAKTATISLWINGNLALEQTGVQTRAASHSAVETYAKFYGQGSSPWLPAPSLKYVRNARFADARIWQGAPIFPRANPGKGPSADGGNVRAGTASIQGLDGRRKSRSESGSGLYILTIRPVGGDRPARETRLVFP